LIYAAEHPDKLFAYVGVGQMVNAPKNFALQRDFDLEEAKARQNSTALRELEAIGAPPFSDADMIILRKWAILPACGALKPGPLYKLLQSALGRLRSLHSSSAAPVRQSRFGQLESVSSQLT
jgi:hypothetical protein